jgi:hypothetical protein
VLFTSELLNQRGNARGASELHTGHVQFKMGHIGDISGESDLIKQAYGLLSSFMQEKW